MAIESRVIKSITFDLMDIELGLRQSGRPAGADEVGTVVRQHMTLDAEAFLLQSRLAIEAVMLGERDLPANMLSLLMDVTAVIDDLLHARSQDNAGGQSDAAAQQDADDIWED